MMARWRTTGLGIVRIVFGIVVAFDAWFKWSPAFFSHFSQYLHDAAEGEPARFTFWLGFWLGLIHLNPVLFAGIVAVLETLVALGLLLGALSGLVDVTGALLMLIIWSTAEAFGGPYKAGSTDIGSAAIYVIVFAVLFFARAGRYLGLDSFLGCALGRWNWLASGPD